MKLPMDLTSALPPELVTPVPTGMDPYKSTLLLTGQGTRVGVKVLALAVSPDE